MTGVPSPVTAADPHRPGDPQVHRRGDFLQCASRGEGRRLTDIQMVHMPQLSGPATPSHLSIGTGLSSGGVTVALDRLEKAGYVRRQPHPTDRRSLLVTLIPPPSVSLRDSTRGRGRDATFIGDVAAARFGGGYPVLRDKRPSDW
jgi:hypothetical protein